MAAVDLTVPVTPATAKRRRDPAERVALERRVLLLGHGQPPLPRPASWDRPPRPLTHPAIIASAKPSSTRAPGQPGRWPGDGRKADCAGRYVVRHTALITQGAFVS